MSYLSKFVAGLVATVLITVVASWELFRFVGMRDASGLTTPGGASHLWFAGIAGVSACIAGLCMFYFFSRYEKIEIFKVAPAGPPLNVLGGNPFMNQLPKLPFDAKRWALANPWLTEGQADDRAPMDGSVTDRDETPPGQRAFARQTHQLMFKKWSQARNN